MRKGWRIPRDLEMILSQIKKLMCSLLLYAVHVQKSLLPVLYTNFFFGTISRHTLRSVDDFGITSRFLGGDAGAEREERE